MLSCHLKVLRDAGLVTTSRRGRWIDYALSDDAPGPTPGRASLGCEHRANVGMTVVERMPSSTGAAG